MKLVLASQIFLSQKFESFVSDDFEVEKSRSVRNVTTNRHPQRHQKSTETEHQIQPKVLHPANENDVGSQEELADIETEELSDKNDRGFGDLIFLVISLVFIGIVMILFSGLVIKHCFQNTL